jgi:hypothetical protein
MTALTKNILPKANSLQDGLMADLTKNNARLEILTDTGWSQFDGVIDKGVRQVALLQLNSMSIRATLDHEVFSNKLIKKSIKQLRPGDYVQTKFGVQTVVSIALLGTESVYDLLNVQHNRRFYANDILCSNCDFVINDETLIAPIKLLDLEGVEPTHRTGQVRWYKQPVKDGMYVVALDPSLGTGGDPAAIQVFDARTTEQVAEWRHNKTDVPTQVRIFIDIIKELNAVVQDDKNIYYSVENNTLGEAPLISIAEFGEDNIPGYFLSDNSVTGTSGRRFRKGFNTTNKSKITACNKFKILVESGRMKIYSKPLISELKTFVAHGTSYKAKPGETDDLVMASLLAVRMLLLLQTYHSDLDSHLKDHGDMIVEPMPFISISR